MNKKFIYVGEGNMGKKEAENMQRQAALEIELGGLKRDYKSDKKRLDKKCDKLTAPEYIVLIQRLQKNDTRIIIIEKELEAIKKKIFDLEFLLAEQDFASMKCNEITEKEREK